jgi:tetratricopeptide (TPR) repeat protein
MSPPTVPVIRFRGRWLALALFLAVLIAYLPSLSGSFLWDDDGHVTQPQLRSLDGLVSIWADPAATQQYYPLLHSAFWMEHKLWGDSPLGYRLINLLLHATAACLFAALLRRLAVPGAWLAAFLFALHPVCVESVAWISEQKNTLSLVFYLAAALAYLRFDDTRRPAAYFTATGLFVAAILSKTVTATLPAALLVLLAWKRARLDLRRDIVPLLPWFVLGLSAGLVTIWNEQTLIGARGDAFTLTFFERTLLAGRAVWFYLGKLLWPAELVFIYPHWTINAASFAQWLFPLAAISLPIALYWRKKNRPYLVFWLLFVGTLFPALGFFNVYPFTFSYVADHFQYHASLSIAALAAVALVRLSAAVPTAVARIGCASLVVLLGALSARQSFHYRSSSDLWAATLAKNPASWLAHNNLGQIRLAEGHVHVAITCFETALHLRPSFTEAENNLGVALLQLGRTRDALPYFERALARQPRYAQAHNNLGRALDALGERDRAMAAFRQAIASHPRFPEAHLNLGIALAKGGLPGDAIPEFARAISIDPSYADAERNLGIALMLTGRFPEAIPHFERAISLAPNSTENLHVFARALATNGHLAEAITRYRQALHLLPDEPSLHMDLALALRQIGRRDEAAFHYQEAQRLQR